MNKGIILFFSTFLVVGINAQNFIGAWERYSSTEDGKKLRSVVLFSKGYQVISTYDAETGKFISTNGGTWMYKDNSMTEKVEFDSSNPDRVGTEVSFKINFNDSIIEIVGRDIKLKRIAIDVPGILQGVWLMYGSVKNGETQYRDTSIPRKTMKILSGTRFQWIAYNSETKQFIGTGGGTYTAKNGEYIEKIEFFSKDDSKVGLALKFNYSLIEGKWNHTGFSSFGAPLHEIWTIRQ